MMGIQNIETARITKKVQTSIRTDYGMYDIFGTKSGKLYTATSLMKLDTYVFSSPIGAL